MATLMENQLRLLSTVCSCTNSEHLTDRLLAPIASALDASSAVFLEFIERPGLGFSVGDRCYIGDHPWSLDAYADEFHHADPLVQRQLARLINGDGNSAPDVTTLPICSKTYCSDYYKRFLQPSDIAHVLAITVPFRSGFGRSMLCLGFHRRDTQAAFGGREARLLQEAAAATRLALLNLMAQTVFPLSEMLVERFARRHPSWGYVVFDEDLMVLYAGGQVASNLNSGVITSTGVVPTESLLGELRHHLLNHTSHGKDARQRFALSCSSGGHGISVEVEATSLNGGKRFLIVIDAVTNNEMTHATQHYGLSRRECEVTHLVCSGKSNAEISRTLCVAVRTVENHLRTIYKKCRVRNRTQLAMRVLNGQALKD